MKRWHEEVALTRRNWRQHRRLHVQSNIDYSREIGKDPFLVDCACDEEMGRFRKTDAYDCGNARCGVCHSDKFPKRSKTYQEICSDLAMKEQLQELDI